MLTVSEWLGKGIELPRMKHAELVNTVLEVEKVCFNKTHNHVNVWPLEGTWTDVYLHF